MCGRTRCTKTPQQVAQYCGNLSPQTAASVPTHQIDRYRPSYNVAPGAYLPVFRVRKPSSEGEAGPVVHCMKWGLVPSFTKKDEKPDHYRMFNARSESIKEKASFRRLIPNNRCVVAVEGFYEWKKDGSKKQPYYIHFKDDKPLVFAALYDSWKNQEGETLYTFTILTTRCSSALEWLHDRMPVILKDADSINLWLNDSSAKRETILRPCEDPKLVWHPVTPAMGKPSFDGPECIKEIQLKSVSEKPLSMFFAKQSQVKSEPDYLEPPKSEPGYLEPPKIENSIKNTIDQEVHHTTEKLTEETKEVIKGKTFDIKREFEETESEVKRTNPAQKRGKIAKSIDDKQASLLSYFGKK